MKVEILTCSPTYSSFPIASWLIKYFQKTNYSHFGIKIGSVVLDATGHDVRLNSFIEYSSRYDIISSYEVEIDCDYQGIIDWCSGFLNKKYGYFQLVGLLLIIMGIIKNNPFGKDATNLICNELVVLFLRDFKGLVISDSDNYDLVSTEILVKEFV